MTDRDALLTAIIAEPDEDTPRLAYADWLDENGDPDRAEFIRAQIEAERHPPKSPEHARLTKRANELLQAHYLRWIEGCQGAFASGGDLNVEGCVCFVGRERLSF